MTYLKRAWRAVAKIVDDFQEVLIWMPPALVLLLLAFFGLPQLDPRSGIDGFGQLYGMLLNVIGGIVVAFSAWLTKRTYLWVEDPAVRAEAGLKHRALDLVEWILCFGFWYSVVF